MKIVHMVMWLTEAVLYMYGVVSHIWKKNLLVRSGSDVTGSRLSPSYGGTLGSTWQDMVSQQLATC